MTMKKIFASVYGCPSNIADYEMSLGILQDSEFEITTLPSDADLNIIFTCIVKVPTEARMVLLIQELTQTNKPLIVAGCMTKTSQRMIEKINPNASIVGPDSIEHITDAVRVALDGRKVIFVNDERKTKLGLPRYRKNESVGIVPISSGCLSNCSYCGVKFARGRLKSYPAEKIIEDVKKLVADGCDEIWLTSQDNGCYGMDSGETNLAKLVKRIGEVDGKFVARVGMMNPTYVKNEEMLDELIDAMKNNKIQKFVHIPVQSGSNEVLKAMRRGYTVSDFEKIVMEFRKKIPNLLVITDIIVGFPTENEKDFNETIELIKRVKPEKVNISKFGARPDTDAAKMEQFDVKVVNERSRKLHEIISSF